MALSDSVVLSVRKVRRCIESGHRHNNEHFRKLNGCAFTDNATIHTANHLLTDMFSSTALSPALQSTFMLLGNKSYDASVEVLSHALQSKNLGIRKAAIETLIARGGSREFEILLHIIDTCDEQEIGQLRPHVELLMIPIEGGLADRDPRIRQCSLCAIKKLKISDYFHHLVAVAENVEDSQQMVASELLIDLASELGAGARKSLALSHDQAREQLQIDLWNSMDRYSEHRVSQIVEAWLCGCHWEDEQFRNAFSSEDCHHIRKLLVRQIGQSRRPEVVSLQASVLWSKNTPAAALELIATRHDLSFVRALSELTARFGATTDLKRHFDSSVEMHVVRNLDKSIEQQLTLVQRAHWLQLIAHSHAPIETLLPRLADLLVVACDEIVDVLASILKGLRAINSGVVVIAMSDCIETPEAEPSEPPPWKEEFSAALQVLISQHPKQAAVIRSGIESLFSEFSCEELIERLDEWPEPHLAAYAKVVSVAQRGWKNILIAEANARSGAKRARALRIIRLFDADATLSKLAVDALDDDDDEVRIEAVYTIAQGRSRAEAIELLEPLLQDSSAEFRNAVDQAISSLGAL